MANMVSSISSWSCTKLRHFFESKSPNWMVNEMTIDEVMALDMKLRQCSREVSSKIAHIMKMVKTAIAQRDRR